MGLRLRIVLSLAVLAAASTTLACATAYWTTESRLYQEVDRAIDDVQNLLVRNERPNIRPGNNGGNDNPSSLFGAAGTLYREFESRSRQLVYATQFLDSSGNVVVSPLSEFSTRTLPVDAKDKQIATDGGSLRRDVATDSRDLRVLTTSLPGRGAVQIARDLTETHTVLDSLRIRYFALAVSVIAVWIVTGPLFGFSDTWQLVINTGTTIITFLMVFLIQNTQNRDTEAIQLKLDELIRATKGAHNALLDLEELEDESLAAFRARYQALAGEARAQLGRGLKDTGTPEV